MKKKNIIWILCDSARTYFTDIDDRGRLDVMDEFAKDAIDFRTAITAAPSTIMSVSSMLTGLASPYLSRDYSSFKNQQSTINNFPKLLRDNGYTTYGLMNYGEGRDFLEPIFGDTCRDIWDGKDTDIYSNDFMVDIFDKFLDSHRIKDPFFVWLHLDCRADYGLSDKVSKILDKLKNIGLYDDSIIVVNSDHGYPDPSRGISFYDKRKYGHDLVMSDDNILAPQILRLPGINSQRIDFPISTLDIFPTIFEYLGLPQNQSLSFFPIAGESILPQLNGDKEWESKLHRSDTRYIFQPNGTICLRNERYKYIYYVDQDKEEFFDILNDPLEAKNAINQESLNNEVESFKRKFKTQQNEIIKYHADILKSKLDSNFDLDRRVILIGEFNRYFLETYNVIFKSYNIDLIVEQVKNLTILKTHNSHDTSLVLAFPCTKDHFTNDMIIKTANKYKMNRSDFELYLVNYNLELTQAPKHWFDVLLKRPRYYYALFKSDPKSSFVTFYVDIGRMLTKIKNRFK